MSVFQPLLEAHHYHSLDSVRTLTLTQGGAAAPLTLSSTMTTSAALSSWATLANASSDLSSTFTMTHDESTNAVTLSSSVAFDYEMPHSLSAYLGFTSSTGSGATSYTSDVAPLGLWVPLGLDYDVPSASEDSKLLEFRAGRAVAQAWHQTRTITIKIKDTRARIERHLSGPIATGGLVKISPTSERANAYKLSQLDGYFVASVVGVERVRTIGQAEELAEVVLECQLSAGIGG